MTYVPRTEKSEVKYLCRWHSGQLLTADDIRLDLPVGSFITAFWLDESDPVELELINRNPIQFRGSRPRRPGENRVMTLIEPRMDAWDSRSGHFFAHQYWHSARFVRGPAPAQTEDASAPDDRISAEAALLLLREKFAALARLSEHYRDKIDEEALTTKEGGAVQLMRIDDVLMRDAVKELNDVQLYCLRIGALVLK